MTSQRTVFEVSGRRNAIVLALLLLPPALLACASYSDPAAVTAPTGSKKTHLSVDADTMNDKVTPAGTITTLAGHAIFVTDDKTTMKTDYAVFNRTTDIANAPGKIQIDDPQNTVIGNSGLAYYKRRDAKITGDVHITIRPKPDAQNAPEGSARREFKEPAYIICDNVDYNWRNRIAVMTGHLVMKYGDRTVTAEKSTYYGNDEKVVLTGSVHYSRPNGDHYDTTEFTAILHEGAEQFLATHPSHAVIEVDDEDGDGGATPAKAGSSAQPGSAGAPRTVAPPPLGTPPAAAPVPLAPNGTASPTTGAPSAPAATIPAPAAPGETVPHTGG